MRKLSPFKAVSHALNSVWSYRNVALRIGIVWVPVTLLAGLIELYVGPPDPAAEADHAAIAGAVRHGRHLHHCRLLHGRELAPFHPAG